MKRARAWAAAAVLLAGAALLTVRASAAQHYSFDAEFTGPQGSAPGPAWTYSTAGTGLGGRNLASYTASRVNSYLDGHGHLVIAVTHAGTTYQSARLVSTATFRQGSTLEARIKLDVQPGMWPAWWLIGAAWPADGEVDMLENYGGTIAETTVHTPAGGGAMYAKARQFTADDRWHTYDVRWTAAGFTFTRDGRSYLTVSPGQLRNWGYGPGNHMRMILNVAVGGIAGPPPPSVRFPVTMQVDYVRAW